MTPEQKTQAIEEIRQTKCRYFRFTDDKKWPELGEVFTRQVVFGGIEDELHHGRDVVVGLIRDGTAGVRTVHHGHNSEVEIVSADEARAITAFEDRGFRGTTLCMHGFGRYYEIYRREEGAWRIAECKIDRMTLVDDGPIKFNAEPEE
jgi:hypothetical protein